MTRSFLNVSFLAVSVFMAFPTFASELVFEKSDKPVAIIGLTNVPKPHDGCASHMGQFIVDEVAYDGVSEIIGGIRVRDASKPKDPPKLMRMDTDGLSNLEASWLPYLVQKGNNLRIAYNVCGNGGFHLVRDIYLSDKLSW